MNDPEDPLLMEHDADGIRELDNKLPRWWVWLFYITIIFSVLYMLHYHVFHTGKLMAAEYAEEMKAGEAVKSSAMSRFESNISGLKPSTDQTVLGTGSQIYTKACAPCHRADGGGLVGPNLTDDYWIHGSNFTDTVSVIWNGVPAKGMVTWKNTLKPDEIYSVASYIYTLRGSKLATPGKAPENQAPVKPTGPSAFE